MLGLSGARQLVAIRELQLTVTLMAVVWYDGGGPVLAVLAVTVVV